MTKKRFYDAFLDGYKPAIQFETYSRHFNRVSDLPFPSYQLDEDLCMFFQTEELKQTYLDRMNGVNENSYEEIYIMGTTLGFPEKSVDLYAKARVLEAKTGIYPTEEEKMYKIGVNWAGFEFAGFLNVLEPDIQWLWNTYNQSKAVEEPFYLWTEESSYIEVPLGDFERLEEVKVYIMKERGLIPAVKG
ncbi:hypothetical protein SAMN05444392_11123 [Seinonella peptonophila]|uniref:Uncharacterized protein n=1 Tax=Seinonella peptonophila TaxID=112248 RepID=A0A1M4ZWW8_9BACL|nr:hypothetical protein [Seinonella peptonophila]SHF22501.1 hypothetical protein SAMN05444392_11123 [Seinonella peptonophila]